MNALADLTALAANPANLPPELLEALIEDYRRTLKGSFLAWCQHVLAPQGMSPARHHKLIIRELEAVAQGETERLMIFLPPGSAKSTYTSILFPPWLMARKDFTGVIAASHGLDLAENFGRSARNMLIEHGIVLGASIAGDNTAAGNWRMGNGSSYYAVGVLGSLTGRRADVIVLDDPVKDQQEADSELQRERTWDWYNSVLLTRLKPGGRVVIVMTRWHMDDLAGRLLATEPGAWRVLKLPALALEDDPLGRAPGEALWADTPEYQYGSGLLAKRNFYELSGASRVWSSLYQQNPVPAGGALFRTAQIGMVEALAAGGQSVRAWDLAATRQTGARDPDWTAGVALSRMPDGRWVVSDVVRLRGSPDQVEASIVATAQRDGKLVRIGLPQDPGQAGKFQVSYLTAKLPGWTVISSPETGDKATRASPVAAQVNVGNFSLVRASWNAAFLAELGDFPAGAKDDQVDALSRAFGMLLGDSYDSSMSWV